MRCFFLYERKTTKDLIYIGLGIRPDGRKEIIGFCSSAQEGKAPGIGKRFSRTLSGAGSKGCESYSPMIFSGLEEATRRFFPK